MQVAGAVDTALVEADVAISVVVLGAVEDDVVDVDD